MIDIVFEIIISVFAVLGFYWCIMSVMEFMLRTKKNCAFDARLYIKPYDSVHLEHILRTIELVSTKYIPDMKVYIDTENFDVEALEIIKAKDKEQTIMMYKSGT